MLRITDDPIALYESLRGRFSRLGPMTFQWIGSELDPPRRLWLKMVFFSPGESNVLVMEFDELSLENFSPSVVQDKVLLVIRSVRERGWDAARYRILDYEEDWLAFYCKAINLTVQPIAD